MEKNEKKILSLILLKFYVRDPLTNFFNNFLMLEDPQKILTSKILNFLEKNLRSGFTGSWQIPKGTKS